MLNIVGGVPGLSAPDVAPVQQHRNSAWKGILLLAAGPGPAGDG